VSVTDPAEQFLQLTVASLENSPMAHGVHLALAALGTVPLPHKSQLSASVLL
jgi:hypothetical protein